MEQGVIAIDSLEIFRTNRKINTFKCSVDGSISLSWNQNNIIKK